MNSLAHVHKRAQDAVIAYAKDTYTIPLALALALSLLVAYIVGIHQVVHHTAAREHAEREASRLSAVVGDLEFSYIGIKNSITLSTAKEHGFVPTGETHYVSRGGVHTASLMRSGRF